MYHTFLAITIIIIGFFCCCFLRKCGAKNILLHLRFVITFQWIFRFIIHLREQETPFKAMKKVLENIIENDLDHVESQIK